MPPPRFGLPCPQFTRLSPYLFLMSILLANSQPHTVLLPCSLTAPLPPTPYKSVVRTSRHTAQTKQIPSQHTRTPHRTPHTYHADTGPSQWTYMPHMRLFRGQYTPHPRYTLTNYSNSPNANGHTHKHTQAHTTDMASGTKPQTRITEQLTNALRVVAFSSTDI
jgi:hypothetical protein